MNILFFAKYYYPHVGGVEKHVGEVSRRLVAKGHRVTVLTMQYDRKRPVLEKYQGIKILRIPYSENKFSIWKNIWLKKDLIKKADIIHCHDVFFWYLPFRFLNPSKKVYSTFHGWEGKYPIPFRNKLVRKISEKLSSGNICIGDYIKKYYGTKPNFVTYGGVSSVKKNLTLTKKYQELIFIGRLEKDMGIDQYLKAFKKIKAKHKLKITFVGDGSYRKQAKKLGQVTGMVKDITPFLNKPALIFSSSYLTILEAMSAGQPVFALYQNPLKKDYLKHFPGAKYIRIASSAEELVSQVNNSLQGRTLKVDKAKGFAKTQTWDKVINIYQKLWLL